MKPVGSVRLSAYPPRKCWRTTCRIAWAPGGSTVRVGTQRCMQRTRNIRDLAPPRTDTVGTMSTRSDCHALDQPLSLQRGLISDPAGGGGQQLDEVKSVQDVWAPTSRGTIPKTSGWRVAIFQAECKRPIARLHQQSSVNGAWSTYAVLVWGKRNQSETRADSPDFPRARRIKVKRVFTIKSSHSQISEPFCTMLIMLRPRQISFFSSLHDT